MQTRTLRLTFTMAVTIATLPFVASADSRRFALVIGNQNYVYAKPLLTPLQDATDMDGALTKAGFTTTMLRDQDYAQLQESVNAFVKRVHEGDEIVIFYAGHGVEYQGHNYLVPTDVKGSLASEFAPNSLNVSKTLHTLMDRHPRVVVIILDACRTNTLGTRGEATGLAPMDAGKGVYIAFATSPGRPASDGTGSNGLFTKHLKAEIVKPGRKIDEVFNSVREKVDAESGGQQLPWSNSSLIGNYYLYPDGQAPTQIRAASRAPGQDAPLTRTRGGMNCDENEGFGSGEGALFQAARCANAEGKYAEAVARVNAAIRMNGGNPDYYFLRGLARKQLDQLPGAEADFRKALDLKPDQAEYLLELGRTEDLAGNTEAASRTLQKAYDLDQDRREICLALASVLEKKGISGLAEKLRQRAVDLK